MYNNITFPFSIFRLKKMKTSILNLLNVKLKPSVFSPYPCHRQNLKKSYSSKGEDSRGAESYIACDDVTFTCFDITSATIGLFQVRLHKYSCLCYTALKQ